MGRRNRARQRELRGMRAPESEHRDAEGNLLVLRGALSARTRAQYQETLHGALSREDAWQRAAEMLFERLVVRWEIAGVPVSGQKALLQRFRVASAEERAWVRDVLREHCAEHFPELEAP